MRSIEQFLNDRAVMTKRATKGVVLDPERILTAMQTVQKTFGCNPVAIWTAIQAEVQAVWGVPVKVFPIDVHEALFFRGYADQIWIEYDNSTWTTVMPDGD